MTWTREVPLRENRRFKRPIHRAAAVATGGDFTVNGAGRDRRPGRAEDIDGSRHGNGGFAHNLVTAELTGLADEQANPWCARGAVPTGAGGA